MKNQIKEDIKNGYWVYDKNGKKKTIVIDMFGHKWRVKSAIENGLLKKVVDMKTH